MTSLATIQRTRSRLCSISISDISPWVRQGLLLWWAQNRTWRKSLSSWWNWTVRFEIWSGEPKATEPSQLSFRTPGSQGQLFEDSRGRWPCGCTARRPNPQTLFLRGVTAIISAMNKHSALSQEQPKCHVVTSSEATLSFQRDSYLNCTNI